MAIAEYSNPWLNTTDKHIIKIWRVDIKTARKKLDVTSQNCGRDENPDLSQKYSSNNKMLQYKGLK